MAKKQKKSSTDSLSALISQMQGELPDISDTNYLEIEGVLKKKYGKGYDTLSR